jgi:uncharacterized membrane protein YeaQ/YmgE (transglycosylase-associated protein family)
MIWALVIGLIVGAVAKFLMPGNDPGGIIVTILLGIAGSILANWVGSAAGWYHQGDGAGIIASIIGAMFLLFIYRLVVTRRGRLT